MNAIKALVLSFLLCSGIVFAQNAEISAPVAEKSAPAADVAELTAEIHVRDSVMALRDSTCKAEGDSLRSAISVEQTKCGNWEKSYETIKQDNAVCQQALRVAINSQTEKNNTSNNQAAMMASSSFLGGLAIGMLLFWLIFE